jgi:hypothetical protein
MRSLTLTEAFALLTSSAGWPDYRTPLRRTATGCCGLVAGPREQRLQRAVSCICLPPDRTRAHMGNLLDNATRDARTDPTKQTPWIRLCRSTGVAPLRGSGKAATAVGQFNRRHVRRTSPAGCCCSRQSRPSPSQRWAAASRLRRCAAGPAPSGHAPAGSSPTWTC